MAKILLIDDEPMVRAAVSAALISAGHDVTPAQNGVEGLEIFSQGDFGLVITDIIMDEMEGLETIIELKKKSPLQKIMAISGGGKLGARTHLDLALKFGAEKILEKPFRLADLLSAVNDLTNSNKIK